MADAFPFNVVIIDSSKVDNNIGRVSLETLYLRLNELIVFTEFFRRFPAILVFSASHLQASYRNLVTNEISLTILVELRNLLVNRSTYSKEVRNAWTGE